jgi:putative salt-induced outer membrane protein
MNSRLNISLIASLALLSTSAIAQNGTTREIQLGGLLTTGNTEEVSINFAGNLNILRDRWEYDFSLDGLYSSSDNEVTSQRFYGVASANYTISEDSFVLSRAAHEDDRFSGFSSQSDFTVSYGRGLLQNRSDMALTLDAGIGVRWSRLDGSDFDEPILRFSGDYDWDISPTAKFNQQLSSESGTDSNIYRSESSIETQVLENLSLRLSLKLKHQTEVPTGRDETDTAMAVTLVMRF